MENPGSPESGYELRIPIDCPPGENPAEIYLAGLNSPHSQRNLARYLNQVARFLSNGYCGALNFNWPELRSGHMATTLAMFAEEYAASTVNGMLSAVRGVMQEAYNLGQISQSDYEQIVSIPNVKNKQRTKGRVLSLEDLHSLLKVCGVDRTEQEAKDRRDAAIIGLLYSTGMKRSELVKLRFEDYDSAISRLQIITGNPQLDRAVILKPLPKSLLDKWIQMRDEDPGALFNPVNKGGRIIRGQSISTQAVYNLLRDRSEQAEIEQVTPHDLRRTFLVGALKAGVDASVVADIAGHSSPDTTQRYWPRKHKDEDE